ncbi:uncharacterized protein LOC122253871 [Penaeus japonicus]|uniref:uncharacterized protein LOC122253871 n=1 Tax=Penaeus japonicus TaxID=27405 RepID=UPI001C713692|nr:uncharacterized protein LOC122253871 [Penaeus japonicus]
MSQWLHSVVRNAVSHHNALHKSLSFVPAVNRYHGSYVVPAANQYHGSYVVPAANQYHGSYVVPAHGLPQSPVVPTTSTTTTTTAAPSTTTLRPRSLEGDTAVNYVGPVPRDNPNAEVFDEELVREDARRHFDAVSEEFGEAQPLSPELIRSQPVEPTSAPVL